jgi:hypothetical protein
MNIITKKSSKEQDYEVLKVITDRYVKAYCYSQSLSGGTIEQYIKLKTVWKQLEQKHGFNHDEVDEIVFFSKAFAQQFQIQEVLK